MLRGRMEMLNAAVTILIRRRAVKNPPPCTAGGLFLAADPQSSRLLLGGGRFSNIEIMCKILMHSAERLLTLDAVTRPDLCKSKIQIFNLTCSVVYPFRLF